MNCQNNHKPDYVMKLIFSPDQITEALTYELYPVIQDNPKDLAPVQALIILKEEIKYGLTSYAM